MTRDFRGTREEEGKKSSSSSRAFLPSYVPLQLALNITPAPAMQAKHTFVVQCSRCFLTYVPSGTNYFGKLLLNDRLRAVFSFTRKVTRAERQNREYPRRSQCNVFSACVVDFVG